MAKQKKDSTHNVEFAKGGNDHMFGTGDHTTTAPSDAAGPQKAGTTTHDSSGGGKFASGGKGKMFGFRPSNAAEAGKTSP
jgi:hypothetical protein